MEKDEKEGEWKMNRIKIKIDGKEVISEKGKTVLKAAQDAGIYIPTLCYHPSLKPHGGCRLCIVQVKGMKGFPVSCATPAEDGMEVITDSDEIKGLRKETLKLLLTEHPNACLICPESKTCKLFQKCIRKAGVTTGCRFCPKDGQCEFQNLVEYIGIEEIGLPFNYRYLPIEDDDPFFGRDYNLCVLCERCIRVCNDVRGAGVLSVYFRGSEARIGTPFGISHLETNCQFCGACVDVCPTGSLYEKQSNWSGVPDRKEESICVLCGIGCAMEYKIKDGRFVSSKPSEKGFNEGQACIKGRFLIPYIVNSRKRILNSYIKIHGKHGKVSLEEAFEYTAKKLSELKGKDFSLILSPYISNEDLYIGQKFARKVMGSNSVDTISSLFYNPLELIKGKRVKDLFNGNYESFVILGLTPLETSQVLIVFLRKKIKEGKKVAIVSSINSPLSDEADIFIKVKPGEEGELLSSLTKESVKFKEIRELVNSCKPALLIYGNEIFQNNMAKNLMELPEEIDLLPASLEGNTFGTFLFGCSPEIYPGLLSLEEGTKKFSRIWDCELPTSKGKGIIEIVKNSEKAGILYVCGEFPSTNLPKAEFIIYQGIISTPISEIADVILPAATFIETEGTYINLEGIIQKGKKVTEPREDVKPDWWIFSQIAKRMGEKGFDYREPSEIFKEIQNAQLVKSMEYDDLEKGKFKIEFPAVEIPVSEERKVLNDKGLLFKLVLKPFHWSYRDFFFLNEIRDLRRIVKPEEIHLSPSDAEKLGIKNGDYISVSGKNGFFKGKAVVNENIPEEFIYSVPDLSLLVSESSSSLAEQILNVKVERG